MSEYTPEQAARVNEVISQALGHRARSGKPTKRQIEAAHGVLGWLSETVDDGALRDKIGAVIDALDSEADR